MKYSKLLQISHAGKLVARLACELYFRKEILKKCIVYGQKDHTALLKRKVLEIKQKM